MTRPLRVHLVDGTWELFRHHFGMPARVRAGERTAVRAVLRSMAGLLESGVTHLGVATDHVVESYRNALWPGYKTGDGIDPHLLAQFGPLEDALRACGVTVWPMVEFEADDALASAALRAAADPRVAQVVICSPDKDLAQCVQGQRIVQWDRRTGQFRDAEAVREHFGVAPAHIPDWLALVGDSADGFPGLPGWGAKSAAAVLARFGTLDDIPDDPGSWPTSVRGAARLADTLARQRDLAHVFRTLARLRTDVPLMPDGVDGLRWRGPAPRFADIAAELNAPELPGRLAACAPSV